MSKKKFVMVVCTHGTDCVNIVTNIRYFSQNWKFGTIDAEAQRIVKVVPFVVDVAYAGNDNPKIIFESTKNAAERFDANIVICKLPKAFSLHQVMEGVENMVNEHGCKVMFLDGSLSAYYANYSRTLHNPAQEMMTRMYPNWNPGLYDKNEIRDIDAQFVDRMHDLKNELRKMVENIEIFDIMYVEYGAYCAYNKNFYGFYTCIFRIVEDVESENCMLVDDKSYENKREPEEKVFDIDGFKCIAVKEAEADKARISISIPSSYDAYYNDVLTVLRKMPKFLERLGVDNAKTYVYNGVHVISFSIPKNDVQKMNFPELVSKIKDGITRMIDGRLFELTIGRRKKNSVVVETDKEKSGYYHVMVKLGLVRDLASAVATYYEGGDIVFAENDVYISYSVPDINLTPKIIGERFVALHFDILSRIAEVASTEALAREIIRAIDRKWLEREE